MEKCANSLLYKELAYKMLKDFIIILKKTNTVNF